MRHTSWYISLPSSAKQHREMTKLLVGLKNANIDSHFVYFFLKMNPAVAYSFAIYNFLSSALSAKTKKEKKNKFLIDHSPNEAFQGQ